MNRKLRIFSNIAIIALCTCLFAFGVYAASTVSVTTSGTVTFNATDVYARVTRELVNIDEETSVFNNIDVTYDASTQDLYESRFSNERLCFSNAGQDIKMIYKIQNLSSEEGRNIYVSIVDNNTSLNNVSKFVNLVDGEITIFPGETREIVVYFRIIDENLSASAQYDYTITLKNEPKYEAVTLSAENSTFTAIKNNGGSIVGYSVTSTTSTAENIIIPAEYNGYPVTQIGANAFFSNASMKIVTLPNSVTTIGSQSFRKCPELSVVNLQDDSQLVTIADLAFANDSKLTYFNFPQTLQTIRDGALGMSGIVRVDLSKTQVLVLPNVSFAICSNLVEFSFPKNATTLGPGMLNQSVNLKHITLPTSLKKSDTLPFGDTAIEYLEVPAGYTEIDIAFFGDMRKLKQIKFLGNPTSLGNNAFQKCESLKEVNLPNSIKTFGTYLLTQSGVEKINIPTGVTALPDYVFAWAENLKQVTFHNNLVSIGKYAFRECLVLEELELPNSITSLSYHILYLAGVKKINIPTGITSIPQESFAYSTSLEEVILHDKLTKIDVAAFYGCSKLNKVALPEVSHTITLMETCFMETGLSGEFYLPDNIVLHTYSDSDCSNGPFLDTLITSFRVNGTNSRYMTIDGVLYRRKSYDSTNANYNVPLVLESFPQAREGSLTIPATVNQLRRYELSNAKYLSAIYVENGNTTFSSNSGLLYDISGKILRQIPNGIENKVVNVLSTVTTLSAGCMPQTVTEIYLPTTLTSITQCVFQHCEFLTKVGVLGQNVDEGTFDFSGITNLKSIGYKSLQHCLGMKKLIVGTNFTSFGDGCFQNATNLNEIYIYNSTSVVSLAIGEYTSNDYANHFNELANLTKIYVPADLVDDYKASTMWAYVADKIVALPA